MTVNELMINDWVDYKGKYNQIALADFDSNHLNWIKELKPILLTPEILEKNGFIDKGDEFRLWKSADNRIILHNKDGYLNTFNKWHVHVDTEDMRTIGNVELTYVHQFQQFLRLCGMNDLADNFKIKLHDMKINELMTGDYVRNKRTKEVIWVFEIDSDRYVINNEPDGYNSEKNISIDDIEPIPLTQEILQKTGWIEKPTGFVIYTDGKRYDNSLWYILSNNTFVINTAEFKIKYVHELQHILRLCGMNDLVDNFKL